MLLNSIKRPQGINRKKRKVWLVSEMELEIQKADDLISISMEGILRFQEKNPKYQSLIKDWNKNIIINITDIYPVTVSFSGLSVAFNIGESANPDLKVSMSLGTLLNIANKRLNLVLAVLSGKLKIKGIFRIGVLLKFYQIFLIPLQKISKQSNTRYFEVYKETR